MKKYLTLSIATLISVSVAHAETLQQALEKSRTLPQRSERVVSVKGIPATLTMAKKCVKVDPSKELVSSVNVSRADDTENIGETEETNNWNVSYAYPLGTFFPMLSYDQTIIRKSDNVVLGTDHGAEQVGILVPPLVENTWTNLIQKTTFTATEITTQWLPDTEICDWIYFNGDYTKGGISMQNIAQSYDLNYVAQPNFALRSNHAPYMYFGDDAYVMNDGKYITEIVSTATFTDEQLANMAGEFDATLISDKTPVTVKADNYKNAGSYLFDYNNILSLSAYYYTLLGNEDGAGIFQPTSLNDYCKSIWSRQLGGITDFSIIGQFQFIPASPKDYVMKGISVEAMYYGPKESPIEYTVYQIDAQGNIIKQLREGILDATEEMAYNANLKLYGGQVTLSASFIDVFTGEDDYLTVPAGTTLMIALTGGSENCVAFSPYMSQYDASNGPDTYTLDNNAGVLVNYQDELIPLPVSFYLQDPDDGSYSMITNFTIAVDVEYPYLAAYARQVPYIYDVNVGGQPTTIYDFKTEFLQDAKTEVDVVLMDVKETEFLSPTEISGKVFEYTGADYNLITNAEAKDVTIMYSDDDVKNAVSCTVANGDGINVRYSDNTTGTVDPAYVFVKMRKNEGATVPTSGWIKASYKGQEVTFNFTATSGIENIEAGVDGEAVATEYFDLQGRKLAGEANGIVIKKMTMADGSVKAVKVVK